MQTFNSTDQHFPKNNQEWDRLFMVIAFREQRYRQNAVFCVEHLGGIAP